MHYRIRNWIIRKQQFRKLLKIHKRFRTHTMMDPYLYADNLLLAQKVDHIPGDAVECGVWRGGMSAGLATVLTGNRSYYLFDSFEGMPPPTEIDGSAAKSWYKGEIPHSYYNNCTAEIQFAEEVMQQTGQSFQLVKGWFCDTVPGFRTRQPIAVLRLDADWYDSILQCLQQFYPQVAPGGIVLLDDYYTWDGCSRAVHDYFSATKSRARIYRSANGVAYFYKPLDEADQP